MYRSESTSSSYSSVNGKSRGELKQVLKENGSALRRHLRTRDGRVTKATERLSKSAAAPMMHALGGLAGGALGAGAGYLSSDDPEKKKKRALVGGGVGAVGGGLAPFFFGKARKMNRKAPTDRVPRTGGEGPGDSRVLSMPPNSSFEYVTATKDHDYSGPIALQRAIVEGNPEYADMGLDFVDDYAPVVTKFPSGEYGIFARIPHGRSGSDNFNRKLRETMGLRLNRELSPEQLQKVRGLTPAELDSLAEAAAFHDGSTAYGHIDGEGAVRRQLNSIIGSKVASALSPEVLHFFRDELEKQAFIDPVRVNQAEKGMLPGRPLLTRFAKSKAGKAYTRGAVKFGPALQDAAMAAGGAAQTYPEPMFMVNSGLGRAARHGLVGSGVPEGVAELATFVKQNDPGIVSMAVRKIAPMLSPLAGVFA